MECKIIKFLCLIFQARRFFFSFRPSLYVLPLSRINVDCVFIESILNKIFVLLEVLSQSLVTAFIRDVFGTLSNIVEPLAKTGLGFWIQQFYFQGFEFVSDCDTYTKFLWSESPSKSVVVLLRIQIKGKNELWVHIVSFCSKDLHLWKWTIWLILGKIQETLNRILLYSKL